MLHLVQSAEGRVTAEGIEVCAEILGITAAEVAGVATFYTMYKRRPVGDYHVGVCTNTLCAVMGGDLIFERLKDHLDVGNDETTEDGKITLEHVECNAACDYAPVMMVNWEFMDNMDPVLGDPAGRRPAGRQGGPLHPRSAHLHLARGRAGAGRLRRRPGRRGPGRPARRRWSGCEIAREHGWTAPDAGPLGSAARRRRRHAVTDMLTPVLSDNWDARPAVDARVVRALRRLRARCARRSAWSPTTLIQLVKDSGLRGRGGAGFPTGMKWGFIPQDNPNPKYLVVNADESEPGTCKDIPLMMASPHTLVEGVIISSYAIRANTAFIYVRGEVLHVVRRLQAAVAEAYAAGHLGKDIHGSGYDLDLVVHAGAGAYICGEETALLDSLEGRRGQPRLRPPFPAVAGLYASPTVINNVESIASVPCIVEQRRGLVLLDGHREEQGHDALLAVRPREATRASTKPRSASRCASCSTSPAASARATS